MLQITDATVPMSAPALNVACDLINGRFIWQKSCRELNLVTGAIIISVRAIKMSGCRKMNLARIGIYLHPLFYCGVGERSPRRRMVDTKEVDPVVHSGQ